MKKNKKPLNNKPELSTLEKKMLLFAIKGMTHSNFDDEDDVPYVSSQDFQKLITKLQSPNQD